ncbi:hypothetical protein DV454_002227 [Geotrichum candidum]|nr:hypothetical protein DV454_002227 [Geotrichum candidum]
MAPLKTAILGANGRISRILIQKLLANYKDRYTPIAVIRNPAQADFFSELGVETRLADLTGSEGPIFDALTGVDVVVLTAGTSNGVAPGPELLDHQGTRKVLAAMHATGVKRLVVIGGIKTDEYELIGRYFLKDYYIARKKADDLIRAAKGIEYTLLRPGSLSNAPATGKVLGVENESDLSLDVVMSQSITREDVAQAIIESLESPNSIGKVIPLLNGEDKSLPDFISNFAA